MKKNNISRQLDIFCKIISHILEVKSPHTAHHIIQVPVLADMLARAVSRDGKIKFSKDDYQKISIAAKLHDCGKTTTPDYLLEKSTKLDCLHNRIHEIRDRFEILRRDAEIACLKEIIANPHNKENAEKQFAQTVRKLEEDFTFIAACNSGETSVTARDIQHLKTIGRQKFKRYFNRLLGLSWLEKKALNDKQIKTYGKPAVETVLQDNLEDVYKGIPTGEIYNLSIPKGTINAEERRTIEQHVVQTAEILNLLHLPKEYRPIINYAAEHHERPNGEGYPLGLKDEELSVPSRIMMIADIFEALTSSERPYKTPKKLSDALHILQTMKNKKQIDADIYHIFVKKQIFMKYAKQYLAPEQIDDININDYL